MEVRREDAGRDHYIMVGTYDITERKKKNLLVRRWNNLGVTGCVKIDNSMSCCTSSFDHVSLVCDKWKESYKK